jgi:DNA-binding NtrC family response regulator
MDQPKPRILVVDDDPDFRVLLCYRLEDLGYVVSTAARGTEALAMLAAEQPALVFLYLRLPELSGLNVLKQIKQTAPEVTVVVMTAYASVEKAVEAMKAGAYDFLTKPLTPGHLELVVQKAFERQVLERAQHLLRAERDNKVQPIIGESPALRQALDRARRAAQSPATVLLLGESGTGKEVFARAIHAWSPRCTQPFVVVNCAALSEELIASDLFGHSGGPSLGPTNASWGSWSWRPGGRYSWMRSASCRPPCKSNCCASSRSMPSSGLGEPAHSTSTSGWSLPPTATCPGRWRPGPSGRTCSSA